MLGLIVGLGPAAWGIDCGEIRGLVDAGVSDAIVITTIASAAPAPSEVAELLRMAAKTRYNLARQGRLPAAKVGGQRRIRRTHVGALIDKGGEAPHAGERA